MVRLLFSPCLEVLFGLCYWTNANMLLQVAILSVLDGSDGYVHVHGASKPVDYVA